MILSYFFYYYYFKYPNEIKDNTLPLKKTASTPTTKKGKLKYTNLKKEPTSIQKNVGQADRRFFSFTSF
jgi:hypothetical protein